MPSFPLTVQIASHTMKVHKIPNLEDGERTKINVEGSTINVFQPPFYPFTKESREGAREAIHPSSPGVWAVGHEPYVSLRLWLCGLTSSWLFHAADLRVIINVTSNEDHA